MARKHSKNRGRNVIQRVTAQQLRQMFNDGDYWGKTARGELYVLKQVDRHPALPKANVPVCTRSQLLSYHDRSGKKVAIIHQYLLPNGSLGASGKPDPKQLLHDGVRYSCL